MKFVLDLFPLPKFNIGKDLTLVVSVGGVVMRQFGLHEDNSFKAMWSEERSTPTNMGGLTIQRTIFGGYEVEIKTSRVNSVVDDLQQFLQDNYLAGNPDPVVTLTQTVINTAENTVNQYQYVDGSISIGNVGDYRGNQKVAQDIKMFFPRRISIATNPAMTLGGGVIPTGAPAL